jgi:hypothetical protein
MALDCKFRERRTLREEIAYWTRTIKETDIDRCITDLVGDVSPQDGISRGCTLKISTTRLKFQMEDFDSSEAVHITGMSLKVLSVRASASSRGRGADMINTGRTGRVDNKRLCDVAAVEQ